MGKSVIVYASLHHGNTHQLAEAISAKYGTDLIDAASIYTADLSGYDLIGFASGIDFGSFYEPVLRFLNENLPENKKVFFLYTCAKVSGRFTKPIREEALRKNAVLCGEYGCRGYNTYGPWKLIGGMNKNHPTQEEIDACLDFFASLI